MYHSGKACKQRYTFARRLVRPPGLSRIIVVVGIVSHVETVEVRSRRALFIQLDFVEGGGRAIPNTNKKLRKRVQVPRTLRIVRALRAQLTSLCALSQIPTAHRADISLLVEEKSRGISEEQGRNSSRSFVRIDITGDRELFEGTERADP